MKTDYLSTLKQFYSKNKRLPSYSEMLKLFNLASKNAISKIIHRWIEDGLLQKDENKLAPTKKFFGIPLLGIIKAGYPILAEENKTYLTLDEYLLEDSASVFLLKVSGDSMINAGIFEGDLVVIDSKKLPHDGDIVLAEVDREWTLKYLKSKDKKAYLQAANSKYPDIHPERELKIHGTVKAVVRKLHS